MIEISLYYIQKQNKLLIKSSERAKYSSVGRSPTAKIH